MTRVHDLLRRVRGALGIGILWAISWGLTGVGIGVASLVTPFLPWDAFFRIFDAPLPALAVPGFFAGLLFSAVLPVVAKRRRVAELTLRQFARWGAAGGALLALMPDLMVLSGFAYRPPEASPLWQLTAMIATPIVLLCSASAVATLRLAHRHPDPIPLDGHQEMLALARELEARP